ncbi:hypothetical protein MTR67_004694 [Solanum verrucosum]|uniref:FBD domain-containing protein n=1 Tax=Solanum verrucosum TaxID=315347 RepID=A0AAF0PUE0_SOLVR|nr:hypothetical protein MTR67_004694 [Solanum verrucosum]
MRNASTSGVDTISNLSCSVLDAILRCLPWKDAVKTSILSKDWRLRTITNFDILEIDAANLKFFEFIGKTKSISFKNAPMLEKVTVGFLGRRLLTDTSPLCSNFPKFFHYIPSLLELDICGTTLEYLIKGGLPVSPPTALNNIKSITISSMSLINSDVVSSAVYLITSCPKLQDLTIDFYPVGDIVEPAVQLLRAQSSSYGVVKLQRVRVNMFTGLEMEMKFMKFILASSPVLEEVSIWNFTRYLFRSCKQMMDEMKEFGRASPNAEFTFEEIDMESGYEHEEVMEVP